MNSISKYDYSSDCSHRREHKDSGAILRCGNFGSVTIPAATAAGTTFTLSSVSIDTKKLNDPCIKLEFASNLITTGFIGTLNFQVFKLCDNQFSPVTVGPQWTYSAGAATTGATTEGFFICDCNTCSRQCCTYTVQVTVGVATTGTITINNAALSALAVSNGSECC